MPVDEELMLIRKEIEKQRGEGKGGGGMGGGGVGKERVRREGRGSEDSEERNEQELCKLIEQEADSTEDKLVKYEQQIERIILAKLTNHKT